MKTSLTWDGREVRIGHRYMVLVGDRPVQAYECVRVLAFARNETPLVGYVRVRRAFGKKIGEHLMPARKLASLHDQGGIRLPSQEAR